jgi:hypothetical protein
LKERDKISPSILSLSSKFLSFLSLHKHQKRYVGTIFYNVAHIGLPKDHQQLYKSPTHLGITQDIPKQLKITLKMAEAKTQREAVYKLPIPPPHATFVHNDDMQREAVYKLPIPPPHATFVHDDDIPPHEIIQDEDLA